MGGVLSRTVRIQISNNTQSFTLKNPRTYFYNGNCSTPPRPSVAPGSSDTCHFVNHFFRGCVGILVYEAESFTLAIYFCNPLNYSILHRELGLELSLAKAHLAGLENIYARMSKGGSAPGVVTVSIIADTCHGTAQVSDGPVQVEATMSNEWDSVIRVEVNELRGSESQSPGKHV